MPAVKPTYNSQSEIPEALREYYRQNGSVWELWDDNEAVAKHFNTGLASNRDALRQEKDALKTAKDAAEARVQTLTTEKTALETQQSQKITEATTPLNNRINELQTELNTVKAPGSVVLSADKAAALAEFEKLGTPADVTKLVKEKLPTVEAKVLQFEKAEDFRKMAKLVEYDADVLTDILSMPKNSGLEIKMKKVKTTVKVNGKDEEKMIDTPHIVLKTAKEGSTTGETEETWTPLTEYADTNWTAFKGALTAKPTTENGGGQQQRSATGTTMPHQQPSGGDANTGKLKPADVVKKSNESRDNAYNPLTNPNPSAKAGGAGAQT